MQVLGIPNTEHEASNTKHHDQRTVSIQYIYMYMYVYVYGVLVQQFQGNRHGKARQYIFSSALIHFILFRSNLLLYRTVTRDVYRSRTYLGMIFRFAASFLKDEVRFMRLYAYAALIKFGRWSHPRRMLRSDLIPAFAEEHSCTAAKGD